MLVKIGNAYLDPAETVFIGDEYADIDGTHYLKVRFKGAGRAQLIEATMDEAEAALIDAGVIEEPVYDEVPDLTEAELTKLGELYDNGYKYLARDVDGKLFAYMAKPNSDGVGFFPSSFTEKATQVTEAFDSLLPGELLDIVDTLDGWTL
jgi:hypothetical protein